MFDLLSDCSVVVLKETAFDLNSHLLQRTGRYFTEINL